MQLPGRRAAEAGNAAIFQDKNDIYDAILRGPGELQRRYLRRDENTSSNGRFMNRHEAERSSGGVNGERFF